MSLLFPIATIRSVDGADPTGYQCNTNEGGSKGSRLARLRRSRGRTVRCYLLFGLWAVGLRLSWIASRSGRSDSEIVLAEATCSVACVPGFFLAACAEEAASCFGFGAGTLAVARGAAL